MFDRGDLTIKQDSHCSADSIEVVHQWRQRKVVVEEVVGLREIYLLNVIDCEGIIIADDGNFLNTSVVISFGTDGRNSSANLNNNWDVVVRALGHCVYRLNPRNLLLCM